MSLSNYLFVIALVVAIETVSVLGAGPKFKFTPCNGYDGPLGDIKISACPEAAASQDYCQIGRNESVTISANIRTVKAFDSAYVSVKFDNGERKYRTEYNLGLAGGECPSKANQEHHLTVTSLSSKVMPLGLGKAHLEVFNMDTKTTKNIIYCVEFPVYVEG